MNIRTILTNVLLVLLLGNSDAAALPNAAEISPLISDIGSTSDTLTIEVAVTTATGLCYSGRFEQESGVNITTTDDEMLPRFHSASLSKLFTAVVVMQLRDEGYLSLNDRVGKFIPEFGKHQIRLKHLLTHTSGLRDRQRAHGRETRDKVDAYINALARQRKAKMPGTKWRYADAGFNLLGRVIEKVTGEPYSDVLESRLLLPLNMKNSSFDIARIPMEQRLDGYNKRGRQLRHPWDMAFLPSSGLQTNAQDLAKFVRAVLRVNAGVGSADFLGFETLKEMTVVRIETTWTGIEQGYGWQINNSGSELVWRHAGGEAGLESLLAIYPAADVGIVALGNQKDWPRFQLVKQIRETIAGTDRARCDL